MSSEEFKVFHVFSSLPPKQKNYTSLLFLLLQTYLNREIAKSLFISLALTRIRARKHAHKKVTTLIVDHLDIPLYPFHPLPSIYNPSLVHTERARERPSPPSGLLQFNVARHVLTRNTGPVYEICSSSFCGAVQQLAGSLPNLPPPFPFVHPFFWGCCLYSSLPPTHRFFHFV